MDVCLGASFSSPDLHRRERPGAATEALALHAEPLERGQPEIRQGDALVIVRRAHEMALMLQSATGEDHGQIAVGMSGAIAHAAADNDERAVHQTRLLQLAEQMRELRDEILLHDLQLREQARLLAVMRETVVAADIEVFYRFLCIHQVYL